MLKSREAKVLADYEELLGDARRRFNEARDEKESLERIVFELRQRLHISEGAAQAKQLPNDLDDDPLPTYRGRATLPGFLKRLMGDGRRRTLDQIARAVAMNPNFADRVPTRNTLSNRMHDLVASGYVRRVERGIYEIAGEPATNNGGGRGGPNLAVHPARQQPPGEDLIKPRPGHPESRQEKRAARVA